MDPSALFHQFLLLPEHLKLEVADFVAFLSQKNNEKTIVESMHDTRLTPMAMAISEQSLSEDWGHEDSANWEQFLKD